MSGSDVEDVQILGTLTKALTELFTPSKADRKNSGKNPPTINLHQPTTTYVCTLPSFVNNN